MGLGTANQSALFQCSIGYTTLKFVYHIGSSNLVAAVFNIVFSLLPKYLFCGVIFLNFGQPRQTLFIFHVQFVFTIKRQFQKTNSSSIILLN